MSDSVFAIEAKGLLKTYTPRGGGPVVEAVRGIDFKVEKGTCTGLLGPNGAGKSTTMKMLMGLTQRSGGVLDIFGHDAAQLSREERVRIALVPQDDNLDPDLTVAENLMVYGMLFGISR
ncbi:MAG: ABC transporter, partial [Pseudomonas fluorescens]